MGRQWDYPNQKSRPIAAELQQNALNPVAERWNAHEMVVESINPTELKRSSNIDPLFRSPGASLPPQRR